MAIDLEQFHQVFFEESLEGLDIMESSLMELDPQDIDDETINAIFRSAHSIKGGSATFGFTSISEFTHVLETLLDQIRSGTRGISIEDINVYLKSVDCMREMLALIRDGEPGDTSLSSELKTAFAAMLEGDAADKQSEKSSKQSPVEHENDTDTVETKTKGWQISFAPYPNIFLSGNDPYRNIIALSELGEIAVNCDTSSLAKWTSYDSEHSYLSWEISLKSECAKEDVDEIFEWIVDDCDLEISALEDKKEAIHKALDTGQTAQTRWSIHFEPNLDILRTGNEPSRLFRALEDLGCILSVNATTSKLPDLFSIDSECCYLSWHIQLESSCSEEDIRAVFEWVEDDCRLDVAAGAADPVGQVSTQSEASDVVEASSNRAPLTVNEDGAVAQNLLQKSDTPTSKNAPSNQNSLAKATKPASKKTASEATSIRVGIDKVDNLINMVGELVITQSMLGQLGSDFDEERLPKLIEGLSQLEQNTRELQESVMKIRMLPISFAFSRFPRMVRDLGQTLGKSVELEMNGENTELDKTVMEKIGDPLVHLVRNAVDHGIESPEERAEKGKDPSGKIKLNAFHQSGNVVIEIIDDGKGLERNSILTKAIEKGLLTESDTLHMSDEAVYDLIFQPGFSTAKTVSDVSGRGVGMDVVKRNIQALSGVVEITSKKDQGSKITIKLPLTLAILDGQLVRVGDQTYIFPLVSIIESLQCRQDLINGVAGGCKVFKLRDEYVPIIELYKSFSIRPDSTELEDSLLVVVEAEGEKVGIVVDELLAQQQVVIKSLEQNYKRVNGVSGATILGDGTVALILDIPGIIKLSTDQVGVNTGTLGSVINLHEARLAKSETQHSFTH